MCSDRRGRSCLVLLYRLIRSRLECFRELPAVCTFCAVNIAAWVHSMFRQFLGLFKGRQRWNRLFWSGVGSQLPASCSDIRVVCGRIIRVGMYIIRQRREAGFVQNDDGPENGRCLPPSAMIRQTDCLRFLRSFTIIRLSLLKKGRRHERNFRLSPFRWAS